MGKLKTAVEELKGWLLQHIHPLMFILASRLADEALWAETLNLGGYNLLVKPFRSDEAIRTVHRALLAGRDVQQ